MVDLSDNIKKLNELESDIKYLKNKIDTLDQKIETFSSKNNVMEYIVSEIQKGQYWRADFDVLKQRVSFIEEELDDLSEAIKKIEQALSDLREFKQIINSIKENNLKILTLGISLAGLIFAIISKLM